MLTTLIATTLLLPQAQPAAAGGQSAPKPPIELKRVKTFDAWKGVAIVAAPSGSQFAASLENNEIRVVDANKLMTVWNLQGHPQPAYALAYSADGKWLASGDETARIFIWDLKTGKKIRDYPREKGHKRGIGALAFSKDGKRLASVGKDDVIHIWSTAGGHPIHTILGSGANFYGCQFLPTGSLVTGTLKEGWRLYEPKAFGLVAALEVGGGQGANDIAVNSSGTLGVTAGRDGRVVVWDVSKRKRISGLSGHGDWVIRTAVAPNGRVAATSSSDMTVRLWDIKSLAPLATLEEMAVAGSPVAFTADGKHLVATGMMDTIQVYAIKPTVSAAPVKKAPVRRRRR